MQEEPRHRRDSCVFLPFVIPSLSRDLGTAKHVRVLVMGDYALAAGSWPNRLALPLANAPRGREKAPLGLFPIRPPTPYH